MFWKTQEQLKAQLEERLRTALEFATLGAYELQAPSDPIGPRETPQRVFLFAKVTPPCPHSAAPPVRCDAAGVETIEHRDAPAHRPVTGTRRVTRRRRRGGTPQAVPQPCTWAPRKPLAS